MGAKTKIPTMERPAAELARRIPNATFLSKVALESVLAIRPPKPSRNGCAKKRKTTANIAQTGHALIDKAPSMRIRCSEAGGRADRRLRSAAPGKQRRSQERTLHEAAKA